MDNDEGKELKSFRLKSEEQKSLWGSVAVLVLLAMVGIWVYNNYIANYIAAKDWRFILGGTREGVVKYDNCLEVVQLKPDTNQRYYHKFTCQYGTGDDYSMTCVRVQTNLFTGVCTKAFVYKDDLSQYIIEDDKAGNGPTDVDSYLDSLNLEVGEEHKTEQGTKIERVE